MQTNQKTRKQIRLFLLRDVIADQGKFRGKAWYEQGREEIVVVQTRPLNTVRAANRRLKYLLAARRAVG